MSIIVKGMKMPDSCYHCKIAESCRHYITNYTNRRHPNCPLVALPDKHGRLVDADAFKADYGMKDDCVDCEKEMRGKAKACEYDRIYSKMDFCGWLDDAPTIVEAEDSE